MKIKTKEELYLDLEDDTLREYLDKIYYPWCHEYEDYIVIPEGTEIVGCMYKTEFIGYRYPSIYSTRIIIYADQIDNNRIYKVIRE
jgi:hypothetical protein